jgi:chemotaxis regulatin CheY-phosphate phosphatase CheZ
MKNDQLDEILRRINDMRGFFRFGDEVIPFLGELFTFLKGIMPLMMEVNSSLKDSAHKLPTASDRINDATTATESATTAILDALDTISLDVKELPELNKTELTDKATKINDEITNIINALQFQDITSQKLEHASRILDAIYDKFNMLYTSIEQARSASTLGKQVLEAMGSDENGRRRTQESDEFEEKTKDDIRHEQISQDDIDSLFK